MNAMIRIYSILLTCFLALCANSAPLNNGPVLYEVSPPASSPNFLEVRPINNIVAQTMRQSMSICAWINPSSAVHANAPREFANAQMIVCKESQYWFALINGQLQFSLDIMGNRTRRDYGNIAIKNDTFTHVAMTFDKGLLALYINGNLSESWNLHNIIQNGISSEGLVIGGRSDHTKGGIGYELFDGIIKNLLVYSRTLTSAEIKTIYSDSIDTTTSLVEEPPQKNKYIEISSMTDAFRTVDGISWNINRQLDYYKTNSSLEKCPTTYYCKSHDTWYLTNVVAKASWIRIGGWITSVKDIGTNKIVFVKSYDPTVKSIIPKYAIAQYPNAETLIEGSKMDCVVYSSCSFLQSPYIMNGQSYKPLQYGVPNDSAEQDFLQQIRMQLR
jgi:hypothetical protein